MVRAFFAALGISVFILGAECLLVDRAVVSLPHQRAARTSLGATSTASPGKVVDTPEWAPWTFLSTGAVIAIYSLTLKRT